MASKKKQRGNRRKPVAEAALLAIQLAFAKKFGRFPDDDDSVFFDPEAETPQSLDPDHVLRGTLEAMLKVGTAPQLIYACYTTGFFVSESNRGRLPKEQLEDIESYLRLADLIAGQAEILAEMSKPNGQQKGY